MNSIGGIGGLQQATTTSAAPVEPTRTTQAGGADSVTKEGGASVANVNHADQANLSSTSGLIAQALTGSDTRSAKVTSLQQAIATGTYSVSSSDVADKIIQSLLD
jgi:negative regulator of flagellin synthesis FlgM